MGPPVLLGAEMFTTYTLLFYVSSLLLKPEMQVEYRDTSLRLLEYTSGKFHNICMEMLFHNCNIRSHIISNTIHNIYICLLATPWELNYDPIIMNES